MNELPNHVKSVLDDAVTRIRRALTHEAVKLLVARLDVSQGEKGIDRHDTLAPAVVVDKRLSTGSITRKRRRGRPRGKWTKERREAHRLRKEKRAEEIRNNPVAQALMGMFGSKPSALEGAGKPVEQIDATSQPSNVA